MDFTDKSKNKPVDLPIFNMEEREYVNFTVTKLKGGFVIIDQQVGEDAGTYAVKDMKDVGDVIEFATSTMVKAIAESMNKKKPDEFVEVFLILKTETKSERIQPAVPEDLPMDIETLTEIVNSALRGDFTPGRAIGLHTGPRFMHPSQMQDILQGPAIAKIQLRVKSQKERDKKEITQNKPVFKDKKEFHSASTNEEIKEKKDDDESRGGKVVLE